MIRGLISNQPDVSNMSDGATRVHCVIEEPDTRTLVVHALQDYGMDVTFSGESGLARRLRRNDLDLIVLDIRESRGENDGLLRRIVSMSVPVIVIDDYRCAANDRVIALELGADDYMAEPIFPRELVARVNSVLRRRGKQRTARIFYSETMGYRFGGLTLDLRTRELAVSGQTPIPLTRREYALLLEFLDKPGKILTREQLASAIRLHQDSFDPSVDVIVIQLRRKLDGYLNGQRIIETKRGDGYVFSIAVEKRSKMAAKP
jgi:two-component system, OmpR family, response regulator